VSVCVCQCVPVWVRVTGTPARGAASVRVIARCVLCCPVCVVLNVTVTVTVTVRVRVTVTRAGGPSHRRASTGNHDPAAGIIIRVTRAVTGTDRDFNFPARLRRRPRGSDGHGPYAAGPASAGGPGPVPPPPLPRSASQNGTDWHSVASKFRWPPPRRPRRPRWPRHPECRDSAAAAPPGRSAYSRCGQIKWNSS
jgi:hypothetical protein